MPVPMSSGRMMDDGGDSDDSRKKKERGKTSKALSAAGQQLNEWGVERLNQLASYKRGGTTRKPQTAKLHRGETLHKAIKRRGRSKQARRGRY